MADLSFTQAASAVVVVGATSTGLETTPIQSTTQGGLHVNLRNNAGTEVGTTAAPVMVSDILNVSAVQTTLSVSTTALECKVGVSTLANRKTLIIQAQGTSLTYGFASGSQPFLLPNGTTLVLQLGPAISVWVRRTVAATVPVAVSEIS